MTSLDIFNINAPAWMEQALCSSSPDDLHYPDNEAGEERRGYQALAAQAEVAIARCNQCPAKWQCLDWAISEGETQGIWGGVWLDRPKKKPKNQNDGKNSCTRGHEFTPENTRHRPNGWRVCLTCERIQSKARKQRPERTHCRNGHELTHRNTYVNDKGHVKCRECHRERTAEWRERKAS